MRDIRDIDRAECNLEILRITIPKIVLSLLSLNYTQFGQHRVKVESLIHRLRDVESCIFGLELALGDDFDWTALYLRHK